MQRGAGLLRFPFISRMGGSFPSFKGTGSLVGRRVTSQLSQRQLFLVNGVGRVGKGVLEQMKKMGVDERSVISMGSGKDGTQGFRHLSTSERTREEHLKGLVATGRQITILNTAADPEVTRLFADVVRGGSEQVNLIDLQSDYLALQDAAIEEGFDSTFYGDVKRAQREALIDVEGAVSVFLPAVISSTPTVPALSDLIALGLTVSVSGANALPLRVIGEKDLTKALTFLTFDPQRAIELGGEKREISLYTEETTCGNLGKALNPFPIGNVEISKEAFSAMAEVINLGVVDPSFAQVMNWPSSVHDKARTMMPRNVLDELLAIGEKSESLQQLAIGVVEGGAGSIQRIIKLSTLTLPALVADPPGTLEMLKKILTTTKIS